MIKHYVDIDTAWGVIFCYAFDESDIDEMIAIMDSFGMYSDEIQEAILVLLGGTNNAMTISRPDLTMSVVFVGDAESIEQFMDSVAHEIDHVQDSICRFYDVPFGSEDAAWLQGYLMRGITRSLIEDGVICE